MATRFHYLYYVYIIGGIANDCTVGAVDILACLIMYLLFYVYSSTTKALCYRPQGEAKTVSLEEVDRCRSKPFCNSLFTM